MKFRFIHTADWHFWDRHKYSISDSRLNKIKENALYIVDFAIKKKIQMIIVAGDVVNVYNPNEKTLRALSEVIEYAISNGIMIRLLMGDHDTNGVNFSLESMKNVYDAKHDFMLKIYSANKSIYIEKWKGHNFVYVPYQKDMVKVLLKAKKQILSGYRNILFTHVGIDSAYYSGLKAIKSKSKVKIKIINDWDYVGLGDYHFSQKISDTIYYSGSIVKINSGERNDVKGFNVVRFVDNKLKVSKVKLNDINFVELNIKYDNIEKFIGKKTKKNYKETVVDIFIYGDIGTGNLLVDIEKYFIDLGAIDVRKKIMSGKIVNIKSKQKKISFSLTPNEACKKYLNDNKIKNKVKRKYGIKVIKKVQEI